MYLMNSLTFNNASLSATVADEHTMEHTTLEDDGPEAILFQLKNAWNRLDQTSAHGYVSQSKRQQYWKDMMQMRQGRHTYYSLGGDDRLEYGRLFTTLNRKQQDGFLQAASQCLHENRVMNDADLQVMVQQDRGKRETGPVPCLEQLHQTQRPSKRARESYYWLQGIHCFD